MVNDSLECGLLEKTGEGEVLRMKRFSQKLTRQGFVVLVASLTPVLASLLVFAFCIADADPLEIYVKNTKMLEYILSALLLAVGGGLLTDYIFRSSK